MRHFSEQAVPQGSVAAIEGEAIPLALGDLGSALDFVADGITKLEVRLPPVMRPNESMCDGALAEVRKLVSPVADQVLTQVEIANRLCARIAAILDRLEV